MPITLRRLRRWLPALLLFGLQACGSSDVVAPLDEIAFLVGDWTATTITLSNPANPGSVIDVKELGGSFRLNVQPSGRYTATLSLLGQSQPEIGTLEVDGDEIIFRREVPSPQTQRASYTHSGSTLTLEGATEADLNNDGEPEEAVLKTTLTLD